LAIGLITTNTGNKRFVQGSALLALEVAGASVGKIYFERGKPLVILTRWNGGGPRNVLIQREDGSKAVRPFRGLRKSSPKSK